MSTTETTSVPTFAFCIEASYAPGDPLIFGFAFTCQHCRNVNTTPTKELVSEIGPTIHIDAATHDHSITIVATCLDCNQVNNIRLAFGHKTADQPDTKAVVA